MWHNHPIYSSNPTKGWKGISRLMEETDDLPPPLIKFFEKNWPQTSQHETWSTQIHMPLLKQSEDGAHQVSIETLRNLRKRSEKIKIWKLRRIGKIKQKRIWLRNSLRKKLKILRKIEKFWENWEILRKLRNILRFFSQTMFFSMALSNPLFYRPKLLNEKNWQKLRKFDRPNFSQWGSQTPCFRGPKFSMRKIEKLRKILRKLVRKIFSSHSFSQWSSQTSCFIGPKIINEKNWELEKVWEIHWEIHWEMHWENWEILSKYWELYMETLTEKNGVVAGLPQKCWLSRLDIYLEMVICPVCLYMYMADDTKHTCWISLLLRLKVDVEGEPSP